MCRSSAFSSILWFHFLTRSGLATFLWENLGGVFLNWESGEVGKYGPVFWEQCSLEECVAHKSELCFQGFDIANLWMQIACRRYSIHEASKCLLEAHNWAVTISVKVLNSQGLFFKRRNSCEALSLQCLRPVNVVGRRQETCRFCFVNTGNSNSASCIYSFLASWTASSLGNVFPQYLQAWTGSLYNFGFFDN